MSSNSTLDFINNYLLGIACGVRRVAVSCA